AHPGVCGSDGRRSLDVLPEVPQPVRPYLPSGEAESRQDHHPGRDDGRVPAGAVLLWGALGIRRQAPESTLPAGEERGEVRGLRPRPHREERGQLADEAVRHLPAKVDGNTVASSNSGSDSDS
ncbi:unnamed protein product, partial [Ectocarpus fasciculatus]